MRLINRKQFKYFFLTATSKVSKWKTESAFLVRGTRFGRLIFDDDWTYLYLKRALMFVSQLVYDRRAVVLFVSGNNQFYLSLNKYALMCSQPYYSCNYVGGSLTNFFAVKRRVLSMNAMSYLPSVLLVFNPSSYSGLIVEALKLGIPVISVFSAEMNLKLIPYPIPCNFSKITISMVADLFSKTILASRLFEAKFFFPVDAYFFKKSRVNRVRSTLSKFFTMGSRRRDTGNVEKIKKVGGQIKFFSQHKKVIHSRLRRYYHQPRSRFKIPSRNVCKVTRKFKKILYLLNNLR